MDIFAAVTRQLKRIELRKQIAARAIDTEKENGMEKPRVVRKKSNKKPKKPSEKRKVPPSSAAAAASSEKPAALKAPPAVAPVFGSNEKNNTNLSGMEVVIPSIPAVGTSNNSSTNVNVSFNNCNNINTFPASSSCPVDGVASMLSNDMPSSFVRSESVCDLDVGDLLRCGIDVDIGSNLLEITMSNHATGNTCAYMARQDSLFNSFMESGKNTPAFAQYFEIYESAVGPPVVVATPTNQPRFVWILNAGAHPPLHEFNIKFMNKLLLNWFWTYIVHRVDEVRGKPLQPCVISTYARILLSTIKKRFGIPYTGSNFTGCDGSFHAVMSEWFDAISQVDPKYGTRKNREEFMLEEFNSNQYFFYYLTGNHYACARDANKEWHFPVVENDPFNLGWIIKEVRRRTPPMQDHIYCYAMGKADMTRWASQGFPQFCFSEVCTIGENTISHLLPELCRMAEIPNHKKKTGHCLRQLMVTTLANAPGVNANEAARMARHGNIRSQEHYIAVNRQSEVARCNAIMDNAPASSTRLPTYGTNSAPVPNYVQAAPFNPYSVPISSVPAPSPIIRPPPTIAFPPNSAHTTTSSYAHFINPYKKK
ncbi:hypothetical protein ACA910_014578 [Epithemia clementina (nom. ined.)]